MKTFILWFVGDNLGKTAIDLWQWLWQIPTERAPSSDVLTLDRAQQLLDSIAARINQMQAAVEKVRNSTGEIHRQYDRKCQEYQEIISSIAEYQRLENTTDTRLAMARASAIERILPKLKQALENSQLRLAAIGQSHAEEQAKLALLEIEMQNIKAYMAIDDSIGDDRRRTDDLNSLQERFRNVITEIEDRDRQIQIMSQLSHSADCILAETLTDRDLDTRIANLKSN
jgi:hypothetical protein